jgi:hypothetical protein
MVEAIARRCFALLCVLVVGLAPLRAQAPRNFLQRAFGPASPGEHLLLSPAAPGFDMTIASRELGVERSGQPNVARLTVPGIPLRFEVRYGRQTGIELYRFRPAPDCERRGEHVRFDWNFPEAYNESMTFDTGALQGQPLYLPGGTVPDNQFTNWGSLFSTFSNGQPFRVRSVQALPVN